MTDLARRGLLPAGLRDVLPPEADHEATVIQRLLGVSAARGYRAVKPPLVEFEDSLLAGSGAAMGPNMFRVMDPVSQRMLGLRADMTLQIARIAATRLKKLPRPLRLSYAGEVLRVKGDGQRPERQFGQVGAELIGSDSQAADAEVVLLAVEALETIGVKNLTVDLSSPRLAPAVVAAAGLEPEAAQRVREALNQKDQSAVKRLAKQAAPTLVELLKITGPADAALAALKKLKLPAEAEAEARRLSEVVALVREAAPKLSLTIDPVEIRGFEYHTGLCFTVFARRVRGELGRGGRYVAGETVSPSLAESATGFTLYMDSILRALPAAGEAKRLFLPYGTSPVEARKWRGEGWIAVAGLEPGDASGEARRLACTHVLLGGAIKDVG